MIKSIYFKGALLGAFMASGFACDAQEVLHRNFDPMSVTATRKVAPAKTEGRASTTAIELPYFESFDADVINDFTIINANYDNYKWSCSYGEMRIQFNQSQKMDDWFITRPIPMQGGVTYNISFKSRAHSNYNVERLEVKAGNAPTVAGMTVTIMAPTDINHGDYREYTGTFTPTSDGNYYVGWHGCSDANQMYLRVDDIKITSAAAPTAPAKAEVSAVPSPNATKTATVTVVAPTKDEKGNDLTSLSKIDILDGDDVVYTFNAPAPGATLEMGYTLPSDAEPGYRTLWAVAYNDITPSEPSECKVYMGLNLPGIASNVQAYEDGNSATVLIMWDQATTDIDGYPQNSNLIRYNLYNNKGELLDEEITEPISLIEFLSHNQRYMYYLVMSVNDTGINDTDYAESEMIAIGTPYTMPYAESFSNGAPSTAWGIEGGGKLTLQTTAASGAVPFDNDKGMAVWTPNERGNTAVFMGGKIVISDNDNASLSFQYYDYPGANGQIEVMVNQAEFYPLSGYEGVMTIQLGNVTEAGWVRQVVSLADYCGKTIKPGFKFTAEGAEEIAIDDVRIIDLYDYNLTMVGVSGPEKVYLGNDVEVTVKLENYGAETVDDYNINLYCNDVLVKSVDGPVMTPSSRATVVIKDTPAVVKRGTVTYSVKLECDYDEDLTDNSSRTIKVRLVTRPYPVPQNLEGTSEDGVVSLSWQPVNLLTDRAEPFTDDFEDYESYIYENIGDWTMVDIDKENNWGVGGIEEFPNEKLPMAFMVFDITGTGRNSNYTAPSGVKHLASFSPRNGVTADDWAISPRLDGKAQTVEFMVSSSTTAYGSEEFEVLASSTDKNVASFTKVYECKDIPMLEWLAQEVALPEGTLYFAIRSIKGNHMFKVDDVTYVPQLPELTLQGYNLYRDGVKLNDAPLATTMYEDVVEPGSRHNYRVSAQYDKGESAAGNELGIETLSILSADAQAVAVKGIAGAICVSSAVACDVEVYNMQGIKIAQSTVAGQAMLAVSPGAYIVKAGTLTQKVVVK